MRDLPPHDLDQSTTDHRRTLAWWLLAVAAMVAVMVSLGGLTRLTGSGLSMAQWNPHHILPPLTHQEWQEAFDQYRQTPEYRLVNAGMDLAGYQGIFWLEYIHRLWGRLIGLAFALPLAWFAWRRMIPPGWGWPLLGLLALGGAQGGLGWLMVASGLVDRPEVSHFRLAAHLLLALVILAALVVGARLLWGGGIRRHDLAFKVGIGVGILALSTMAWGALVAGLDAGRIHNTFPLMSGAWWPAEARAPLANMVESPAAVQYVHRVLALTTWACLSLLAAWAWLSQGPRALVLAGAWAWGQAGLGIATLLYGAPLGLAALHQGGAVVLLALLCWGLASLRR
ncbi:MAG: COX15/CtaA family protein [Magnetospirillum sp.]|nr:COX15/CtaA family protein [Magnetospirillum sp.]